MGCTKVLIDTFVLAVLGVWASTWSRTEVDEDKIGPGRKCRRFADARQFMAWDRQQTWSP
jgi:hypothetical protein